MSTDKDTWIRTRFNGYLDEETRRTFNSLPTNMQQGILDAVKGLYHWGQSHERSQIGAGIEPTYYIPEPAVEIAQESRDVA